MPHQDLFLFLLHLEQSLKDKPEMTLAECASGFQAQHPGFLLSQKRWAVLQCYALIVLPWEKLKRSLPKKQMLHQLNHHTWGSYEILDSPTSRPFHKMDLRFFLRKLRNASSHGRITFPDDGCIWFMDSDGTKIRFTQEGLQRCMARIAGLLET